MDKNLQELNKYIVKEELESLETRYNMPSKDFKKHFEMTREIPEGIDEVDGAFWLGLLEMKNE